MHGWSCPVCDEVGEEALSGLRVPGPSETAASNVVPDDNPIKASTPFEMALALHVTMKMNARPAATRKVHNICVRPRLNALRVPAATVEDSVPLSRMMSV